MGQNESSFESDRQHNIEGHDGGNRYRLQEKYKIEELADTNWRRPLYIYECLFYPTTKEQSGTSISHAEKDVNEDIQGKVSHRVRPLVIKKAVDEWLEQHQVEYSLYVIDRHGTRLYTQFVIDERRSELTQNGPRDNVEFNLRRELTVRVPRLVGGKYVHVNESYGIRLKSIGGPIRDLRNTANDKEVQRAMISLLLADVSKENSFAVAQSKHNCGLIYNQSNGKHKRFTESTPCIRSCRGLRPSIGYSGDMGGMSFWLEEVIWSYFRPINMIELLISHFKFDVEAPLNSRQIATLYEELYDIPIEMRPGDLSGGDESLPSVHRTSFYEVSEKPICEELCDQYDDEGNVVGTTTVKEMFEHTYPHTSLKYTHLPCLIGPGGGKMPIEMCWIALGETYLMKTSFTGCKNLDSKAVRCEIFEENRDDFVENYTSTFRKFGFQLRKVPQVEVRVDEPLSRVTANRPSDDSNWRRRRS